MKKLILFIAVLTLFKHSYGQDICLNEDFYSYVSDNGELTKMAIGVRKSNDSLSYLLLLPQYNNGAEVYISSNFGTTPSNIPMGAPGQFILPAGLNSISSLSINGDNFYKEITSINDQIKRDIYTLTKRASKAKSSDATIKEAPINNGNMYEPLQSGSLEPIFSDSFFENRRSHFSKKYEPLPKTSAYYFQKAVFLKKISAGLVLTSGASFAGCSFINKNKTRNICFIASGAIGLGGIISYFCALSNENKAAYKLEYELGKTASIGLSDNGSGIKISF